MWLSIFIKLKTAYEMRISDWSSDVCSSDLLVVSHERDLLNNVVDHILHLDKGRLTLYPGGYDAFERQRAERLALQASAREKQQTGRAPSGERVCQYV